MIRALFVLVIIMAACTATEKKEAVEIPVFVIPESPVADTRTKREPTKPKKPAPKPVEKPTEPEPEIINPIAECTNIKGQTPEGIMRAKLACITKGLGIEQ